MHPLHSIYKRHKMTINTPDGYTFYIGWGGMVVDNLQPAPYSEEIDLSWNSLEDFISDSDGYFDLTVDFGRLRGSTTLDGGQYAKFEIVNETKICRGVDGFDISVWTYSDTDSGDTSPFNYVSDLKTPVDVAEWIVEQLMEMFDARQNNEWDAIYLGEEI
jgi:hypothetical protein